MAHKTAVSTPAGSSNVYHQFVTGKYPYGAGHPGPTKSHAEGTMSYAKVAAMPPGTSGKAQHPVQYYESHDGFVPKFRSDGGTIMVSIDETHQQVTSHYGSASAPPRGQGFAMPPKGSAPKATISDEVISISSEDDGAKKQLPPNDSIYRGPGPSRITTDRGPDIPMTRAAARRIKPRPVFKGAPVAGDDNSTPAVAPAGVEQDTHGPIDPPSNTKVQAKAPRGRGGKSGGRGRGRGRKAVKSSRVVLDDSGEDRSMDVDGPTSSAEALSTAMQPPPNTQPRTPFGVDAVGSQSTQASSPPPRPLSPSPLPKTKAKRKRRSRSTPTDKATSGEDKPSPQKKAKGRPFLEEETSDSDSLSILELVESRLRQGRDIPDKEKLVRRIKGLCKLVKRWKDGFLDLEAEVEDDEQSLSNYDGYEGKDMDKYDSSDSFIDDKGEHRDDEEEDDNQKMCDAYVPGLELEDFAREQRKIRDGQVEDDRNMAIAIDRNDRFAEDVRSRRDYSGDHEHRPIDTVTPHSMHTNASTLPTPFTPSRKGKEREYTSQHASSSTTRVTPDPVPQSSSMTPSSMDDTPSCFQRVSHLLETPGARSPMQKAKPKIQHPPSKAVLPAVCEVNDPTLHDPMLANEYAPGNLPNLAKGILLAWSEAQGLGQVYFSAWVDHASRMNLSLARQAIAFAIYDNYVNASRADPTAVHMRELQSGNPRFHAYIGDNPAVFLSCIFSELCKLQSLSTIGLRQKLVQGKFHSQEWERFMAFLCMISGFRSLHANLARDSMHFVTRPLLKKEEQVNGGSRATPRKGMFTGASAKSTNGIRTDNFSLDANAEVPIYDARYSADFDFMEDLVNIDRILPRWEGEIPYGSFVVVAYTIAVYRANNGHWTLSCNIQWAMIVGIADEEDST